MMNVSKGSVLFQETLDRSRDENGVERMALEWLNVVRFSKLFVNFSIRGEQDTEIKHTGVERCNCGLTKKKAERSTGAQGKDNASQKQYKRVLRSTRQERSSSRRTRTNPQYEMMPYRRLTGIWFEATSN